MNVDSRPDKKNECKENIIKEEQNKEINNFIIGEVEV